MIELFSEKCGLEKQSPTLELTRIVSVEFNCTEACAGGRVDGWRFGVIKKNLTINSQLCSHALSTRGEGYPT